MTDQPDIDDNFDLHPDVESDSEPVDALRRFPVRIKVGGWDLTPTGKRRGEHPDINDIRKRLAAATPGPWAYRYNSLVRDGHGCEVVLAAESGRLMWRNQDGVLSASRPERSANATLVAHAPTDIAVLLARIDELEAEVERAHKLYGDAVRAGCYDGTWESWRKRAEKAEAEVERLRAQTETQATLIRGYEEGLAEGRARAARDDNKKAGD